MPYSYYKSFRNISSAGIFQWNAYALSFTLIGLILLGAGLGGEIAALINKHQNDFIYTSKEKTVYLWQDNNILRALMIVGTILIIAGNFCKG